MQRVAVYVDGFNLYFGLKSAGFKRYFWLDLPALARRLLRPGQQLVATHYFTSYIRNNQHNAPDRKRQGTYIEALQLCGVHCQFGHYLEKQRNCLHCHTSWTSYEEKMTDVNLAIQLLTDAFDDNYDVALVISGDSDLTTPICRVRNRFPSKRLIVAFPPRRQSSDLKRAAHGYVSIGEDKLRSSQLPGQIIKPDGHILQRPATWN